MISAFDIWGAAYRDASRGKLGTLLIRRDDGVADDTSSLLRMYFEPPGESDVQLLQRLSGPVLDIGCGVGRHALWLQEHGVDVTGVDNSTGAIEIARQRGCRDVRLASIESVDFADGSFGGAILLANGAGIGGTEERSEGLFVRLARMVRPGGLLIAQGHDPLRTSDPAHLAYHQANREAGRPPGQLRLRMEYNGAAGEWFDLLLFEPDRLTAVLERSGWRIVESNVPERASSYVITAEATGSR